MTAHNANLKPATPLPWAVTSMHSTHLNGITNMIDHSDPLVHVECHQENKRKREQDAAYIVHACNAYPKLVAALKMHVLREHGGNAALHLLRSLGEAE